MKTIFLLFAMTLTSLVLTSCASVPMTGIEQDQEAKEFKSAPNKSRLYIYRNENLGAAIKVTVSVDGKLAGQSAANTFFALDLEPGQHQVACLAESNSQISVNMKKGQATYVWQEMKMGLMSAGCAVHEVTADVGQAAVNECKRAQSNF